MTTGVFVYRDGVKVELTPEEIPTPDLAALKARRRDEVNRFRDEKNLSDITFNGVVFQADQRSQDRLDRARTSALSAITAGAQQGDFRWHGQSVDFFWIAKDNTQVVMDAQTTVLFGNAMVAREGLLIATAAAIKNAIDQIDAGDPALTVAAVEAFDITQGWPA